MTEVRVAKQVKEMVRRHLGVSHRHIDLSTRFVDDLGADSLVLVDRTLSLEERFDIDIEEGDLERLRTVEDAVQCVERCLAARRASGARAPLGQRTMR
jgi:acyl carrier protein